MNYPLDIDQRPMRRIPAEIRSAISVARKNGDWRNAGRTFGHLIVKCWPRDRVLEDCFKSLDALITYAPITTDGTERTLLNNRLAALMWFHARAPAVVSAIPWASLGDFIDGTMSGIVDDAANVKTHAVAKAV